MNTLEPNTSVARPSSFWPGMLLGSLLMLFVAAFVYVAYVFVAWGQTAAAQAPDMAPLSLPKLVRSVPANQAEQAIAPVGLLRPTNNGDRTTGPLLTKRLTVLVMGVDNRPGQTVARTDSIMVMTINPADGTAGLLSLPRDLLVPVPALNDNLKINTVHVYGEIQNYPGGGPVLLKETVSELIDYPVDYYVRLNFEGFRQIIDLLGGIDIDVPVEIRDEKFPDDNYGFDPLYIPAGLQHMDGATALKYARVRHIDSDYQRAGRQQQVVVALKDKVLQPGQLAALLPRLPGLAIAMANSVQTDMPVEKAITLARAMGETDLKEPIRVVVDNTMGVVSLDPKQGYILTPDMSKLRAVAASVFAQPQGEVSQGEAARQALQAEGARLVVLNGTAQEGLAARTAETLSKEGFNVVAVGNAERVDYALTWLVTYGDGKAVAVETLAQRLGITPDRIRSEPPSETADLTLVIGTDQAGATTAP